MNQTDEDKKARSWRSRSHRTGPADVLQNPPNLFTDQLIAEMMSCTLGGMSGAKSNTRKEHEKAEPNKRGARTDNSRKRRENSNLKPAVEEPQTGKLYNADRTQYIKRRQWTSAASSGDLPYSAKFLDGGVLWKLHGEGGLLTSGNSFVAQVTVTQSEELDRATSFNYAKQMLKKNWKVGEVLVDLSLHEVERARQSCDGYLKTVFANTIANLQNAEDLFQLETILKLGMSESQKLAVAIKQNIFMSDQMKQILTSCIEIESCHINRNKIFNIGPSNYRGLKARSSIDILRDNVFSGMNNHKQKALEVCPAIIRIPLTILQFENVLFVTKYDLQLFSDMINAGNNTIVKSSMFTLVDRYFQRIKNRTTRQLKAVLPVTNHIFFYLCKSLTDVKEEIESKTSFKNILKYEAATGWKQLNINIWKSSPSMLEKCLEHQLKLLLKLVNHFEIGRISSSQRFPHKFKVFTSVESSPEYQQVIAHANKAFGRQHDKTAPVLPDELHVWICLLDDTIAQFFSDDEHIVKLSSALLKLYMNYSLSGQLTLDSLESLRVITHNTIRFVAQAGPFVHPKNDQDNYILVKQIGFMNRASLEGRMSFVDYRDLIEVFAQYWKQRGDSIDGLVDRLPGECFKQDVDRIQSLLLQCLAGALDKNVKLVELINFCRLYEELLVDLHNLPLDWFVRMPSTEFADIFLKKGVISVVENKWKDSDQQCYRVKDFKKFEQLYQVLFEDAELPPNFLVKALQSLLKCITDMENKKSWRGGRNLTESEQLNATGLLITSIRSSLLYLKEQPEYISFDRFLEESTKPFTTVSTDSCSFEDFEKRILLIKESYWYIRNLNVIDIDTALKLYNASNESNFNEEYLRLFYRKYSDQFDKYMTQNTGLDTKARITPIVADVRRNATKLLAPKWNIDFKFNKLPLVLAGLGAVWALHVSKDVLSSGQYLKPHSIQILCVFRLLSVDRTDQGVRKHLAQVLTGQGKSLVLALVASVLALCGHSVQIMCYSKYLATRDERDFKEFYDYFGIRSKILYQTFSQAASEHLDVVAGNAKKYVHKCIGLPEAELSQGIKRQNPVLLIDEVDVFFDEKLYGESQGVGSFPDVPGLDKIQLKIWNLVEGNCLNVRSVTDDFITRSELNDIAEFKRLMNKLGVYPLLNSSSTLHYSNAFLFSKQLDDMISTAKHVTQMKQNDSFLDRFRLNSAGNITYRNSFGGYSENTYHGYYNTFIYFRLKKSNFEERPSNYGYFNFHLGSTSYAKLPESYPLILGVSGTLTTLSNYEKKVVKDRYNIGELSVMPSFFGGSNLKFNESTDFACFGSVTCWMNAIFGRINMMVYAKRSVLVIFDTDVTIDAFRRQFAGQLDRLNVLTVDTSSADKERFITDAGVSRTITLATREMGRGVDYKSSVAVEKNGGVHVIQSFFSEDVKEETQIKGRTARKDNRGSYELIVCIEDLRKQEVVERHVDYSTVTYAYLDQRRTSLLTLKEVARDEKLKAANEKHDATIAFYKNI